MSVAAPVAGVLTNAECEVDLAAIPPRSRVVFELVGDWRATGPEVRLAYERQAVVLTIPGALLNMPDSRLPVHDGLVDTLAFRGTGDRIVVSVETRFPARAELAWFAGLPARLVVEFPRTGPVRAMAGRRIGLDPGHGGRDTGAVGVGYREADIALSIGSLLTRWLEIGRAHV